MPKEEIGGEGFKGVVFLARTNFSDQNPDTDPDFGIEVRNTPLEVTIQLTKEELQQSAGFGGVEPKEERVTVDNHQAVKLTYTSEVVVKTLTVLVVSNGTYTYTMTFQHSAGDVITDQILSTFKFTK